VCKKQEPGLVQPGSSFLGKLRGENEQEHRGNNARDENEPSRDVEQTDSGVFRKHLMIPISEFDVGMADERTEIF
jgi:hypothetical protein